MVTNKISEHHTEKSHVSDSDNERWLKILLEQKNILKKKTVEAEILLNTFYLNKSDANDSDSMDSKTNVDFLYDEIEKKLVWTFGTPRSGSTWLVTKILKQQRFGVVDESGLGIFLGAFWPDPMPYFWLLLESNGPNPDFIRMFDQKFTDDHFFSEKYEKIWKKFLRSLILERFNAQFV